MVNKKHSHEHYWWSWEKPEVCFMYHPPQILHTNELTNKLFIKDFSQVQLNKIYCAQLENKVTKDVSLSGTGLLFSAIKLNKCYIRLKTFLFFMQREERVFSILLAESQSHTKFCSSATVWIFLNFMFNHFLNKHTF